MYCFANPVEYARRECGVQEEVERLEVAVRAPERVQVTHAHGLRAFPRLVYKSSVTKPSKDETR